MQNKQGGVAALSFFQEKKKVHVVTKLKRKGKVNGNKPCMQNFKLKVLSELNGR